MELPSGRREAQPLIPPGPPYWKRETRCHRLGRDLRRRNSRARHGLRDDRPPTARPPPPRTAPVTFTGARLQPGERCASCSWVRREPCARRLRLRAERSPFDSRARTPTRAQASRRRRAAIVAASPRSSGHAANAPPRRSPSIRTPKPRRRALGRDSLRRETAVLQAHRLGHVSRRRTPDFFRKPRPRIDTATRSRPAVPLT